MRLFQSKRFWCLVVFIFLIMGAGFGLYYFNLLQKIAPKQDENIFLVDDFERNPMQNILGGGSGTYQRHPSKIYSGVTKKSYYRKKGRHLVLNYDQKISADRYHDGGWCGYYSTLARYKEGGREYFDYLDSTPYDYLCFFVKGKVGGEKFTVGLADKDYYARKDSLKSEEIGKYLKKGKVTTRWQKAVIPLDNYSINRNVLASIGICFEEYLFAVERGGKGTVYIDNLAFVKDPRSLPGINYPTKRLLTEAKVTKPKAQIPNIAVVFQNLRNRIVSYKETLKLTPRLRSRLIVSEAESSKPPEPKKPEPKIKPQKPREGIIWISLGKRMKTNWLGFKILGALVLLGLSLVGGIRLYSFLLKKSLEWRRKKFEFAHEIKEGLLPISPPQIDGISFGVRNISPPKVKGDFYNFIGLDKKKIAIMVGHVLGEGGNILGHLVKVANYLQYYAPLYQRPTKLLSVLNELLAKDQTKGNFTTMIYSILDMEKHVITISNAGHDPMMLLHAQTKEIEIYNTLDRTPLGMIADRRFTEQDIPLSSGDLIFLHTCGVTAARNGRAIPFGIDRLKDSVDKNRGSDATRLIDRVMDDVTNFTKKRFQDNELTLVAMRLE